jgi:hypothetical protein
LRRLKKLSNCCIVARENTVREANMSGATDAEKERIREEIRARDVLLDMDGILTFKYSVKKAVHMGNDSVRELEINLDKLTIAFSNSRGVKDTYDISIIISVSPTDIPSMRLPLLYTVASIFFMSCFAVQVVYWLISVWRMVYS